MPTSSARLSTVRRRWGEAGPSPPGAARGGGLVEHSLTPRRAKRLTRGSGQALAAHGLHCHSAWRPWLYIQAAAAALAAGSQIDPPALPSGVAANVEGMNWKRPEAPEGLRALGLYPDSQSATVSPQFTAAAPSGEKALMMICWTEPSSTDAGGGM